MADEILKTEGVSEAQAATPVVAQEVSIPAPPLPQGQHYIWAVGRRKKAIARIRIRPGSGKFMVNKRDMEQYFRGVEDRNSARLPLNVAKMATSWDVFVNVTGGGFSGQAGAVMMGLARAIAKGAPESEAALRDHGLMTRDARMKERKKYGQKGARKAFQWTKR